MKNKWIYIEPTVFIWQDSTHYLFYNAINSKKVFIPHNNTINPIVQSLCIEKNSYCTKLDDDISNNKEFEEFIDILSSNRLGNIITCYDSKRPVNIPPKLILDKPVENIKTNGEYFDPKILDDINELIIQLSGNCNINCKNCSEFKLQLIHCSQSEHTMSNEKIEQLIKQVKHLNLKKLNIIGGDLLSMKKFESIIDLLSSVCVKKIFNVHYHQLKLDKIQYLLNKDETSLVRICVHFDGIEQNQLLRQIEKVGKYNARVLWSFIVSSENELEFCYSILNKCKSIQHEIKPFYNKNNEEFIREFVFVNQEDIDAINLNKREIFANQVLNRNYFGKITILANGKIFDNINFKVAGNIDDCLEDVIHKIITEGRSWRWIRSNDICDNCLYKLICPPPSNLELVMKSKVICQTPKSYKSA
ncbi:MAG: TIGR04150 pseudo-rSAM protein [Mariniphaga sp.]|nr:TIGR04150 pseudo-rSAM protein [Mariniphaga sp.]